MTNRLSLEELFLEVSEDFLREDERFSTLGECGVFSHAAVIWLRHPARSQWQ